ncbi:piezo-type mechanosensitive ion channel component 2-like [Talpa occidentalis]|uniref:piezo-type mechanosensitive ion channel component 2-like n=1 Tax=Talpa occidentalis TaxID=50954 RepID=UPI0023F99DCC|nr:piezo-type mechanosensitive ion channel component 2-like [Talpa occidentalis]
MAWSLYAFLFWLLLRQQVLERQMLTEVKEEAPKEEAPQEEVEEASAPSSALAGLLGSFLKGLLVKYWIFICATMFFVVSFDGKVAVYKIIYIFLFLSWVALYQMHYDSWRRILKFFWMAMVSYSMVVLVAIYTYQFQIVAGFFNQTLGLSEEGLRDVGLERFDTVELFAKILLPATFLLACILQLHYFNEDFLRTTSLLNSPERWKDLADSNTVETHVRLLSDMLKVTLRKLRKSAGPSGEKAGEDSVDRADRPAQGDETPVVEDEAPEGSVPADEKIRDWDLVIDKLTAGFLKLLEIVNGTQVLLWRILEIHVVKLVSPVIIWFTLQEVSLMNSLFYVCWVAALPYSTLRPYASHFCTVWACVMVICKMMYQLKSVVPASYSSNCTEVWPGNSGPSGARLAEGLSPSPQLVDPAEWLGGLRKCDGAVLPCLKAELIILALMTLEVTVSRHQRLHRLRKQLLEPFTSTLMDSVTRAQLDEGLLSALKYFINYGFYKFGLELCLLAALNAIGQRMDFYSLVHVIWLIYLLNLRRRKAIAEIWPRYCGFLVTLAIFQYFLCLGMPPAFCTDDFLLLLAASLQWQVFEDENKLWMRVRAGDNMEISRELRPEDLTQLCPVPNFVFCRSYLDMVKVAIFRYHFWLVLGLLFLAGTTRINILGAGYLVAFGYFMMQGSHLLLKPVKFILRPWDRLIAYSVLVVAAKTFLSVGACVYLETLLVSHCWLVHSFGMYCTVRGYHLALPEDEACEVPEKEAGILWDTVCFAFLLVQRRIFLSYYHLYVVADQVAAKAVAHRGAEILEQSQSKALALSAEEEIKSRLVLRKQMDKIKEKQKKIEARQQACRSPEAPASGVEATGRVCEGDDLHKMDDEEAKKWWQPWVKHPSMVQEGSYSLFETDSEEEEAEGSQGEMKDLRPKPKTAFQLAHDAWTNSSQSALRMRRRDEGEMERDEQDQDQRRRGGGSVDGRTGGESLAACEPDVEAGAEDSDEPAESKTRRLLAMAQFSWVLGKVLMDDIIEALGNMCRDSTMVAMALREERFVWWRTISKGKPASVGSHALLQEAPQAAPARREEGLAEGPSSKKPPGSQEPHQEDTPLLQEMESKTAAEDQGGSPRGLGPEAPLMLAAGCPPLPGASLPQEDRRKHRDPELEQSDRFYRKLPRPVRLVFALYQVAESRSLLLCYCAIILNHTLSASILTMVLPMLSFLWAMLSIPRPSRRFWMAATYYTKATIVVKYFSQFGFLPWTTKRYAGISREKPFSLPNIMGIEKKDSYVLCDLLQLLLLFFHRSTMKGIGLWDHQPSKQQPKSKGKKKSRRKGRKASRGAPGSSFPQRAAKLDLSSQERAGHRWAFWKGWRGAGSRGGPKDPGPKKGHSFRRKLRVIRKKFTRKMLKKLLEKARKLAISRALQIYRPIRQFFYHLTHPQVTSTCDVYAITFLVEALNFAIILCGYGSFGKSSGADLAESLSEDKVPEAFLSMVLLQFGTMIVDRALYLRKTLFGKCVFQVALVVGIHFWLFFILPGITERRFNFNLVAQIWYLVKCIYFGLSAYQIKCGYPGQILGNFLAKNFNLISLLLFTGFRFIPFLLELRAVIGWVWTDTALSLSNWICLEDIYANVFIMKCWQESAKKYPQPPGRKKKKVVKYGVGGVITFALVFLMWFPLVFMSLLKTVGGVTNQPLDVSIKIAINGYEVAGHRQLPEHALPYFQTLFTMSSQDQNLAPFSDADYDQLTQQYALHPSAMQFLADYRPEDIVLIKIKSHASLLWGISPANREAMVKELTNATTIHITTSWTIQSSALGRHEARRPGRHSRGPAPEGRHQPPSRVARRARGLPGSLCEDRKRRGRGPRGRPFRRGAHVRRCPAGEVRVGLGPGPRPGAGAPWRSASASPDGRNVSLVENVEASGDRTVHYTDKETRDHLVQMLTHARTEPVMLRGLIPKVLRTTAGTEAKIARQLNVAHSQRPKDVDQLAFFRNITVRLQGLKAAEAEWWVVQEWRPNCNQGQGCSQDLELLVCSDKVSPQSLGFLAGYGIVGLYVSVVMVAAKMIREQFLGISRSIMYEELPNVDRVYRLCTDIFLVRELGELELEQQLFAKLIFLYRSPETMIKWTRECLPAPPRPPPPDPVAGAPVGQGQAAGTSAGPEENQAFGSPPVPPMPGTQASPEPAAGPQLGPRP